MPINSASTPASCPETQGNSVKIDIVKDIKPAKNSTRSSEVTRQNILQASAELFASQGYTSTSTRLIAERVGIQQPTLYYYFPHKRDILSELLLISVRPSIEIMHQIDHIPARQSLPDYAGELLMRLIKSDIETLGDMPIDVAALYGLPEVAAVEFQEFHHQHAQLCRGYGELAALAAMHKRNDAKLLGETIITLVEHISSVYKPDLGDPHKRDAVIFQLLYLVLAMLGYSTSQIDAILLKFA